jgi:hypothetical protein
MVNRSLIINLFVATVSLILVVVIGWFISKNLAAFSIYEFGAQAYYILITVLALAASVVLFGILRSTASVRGSQFGYAINLGGPAAVFFLVIVVGLQQLKNPPSEFVLTLRFTTDNDNTIAREFKEENVKNAVAHIFFPTYNFKESLNSAGLVTTGLLPWKYRQNNIDIKLESDVLRIKDHKDSYSIPPGAEPVITLTVVGIPPPKIVPEKTPESTPIPKTLRYAVVSPKLSRITSGGTSDGRSPFCQRRSVQDCVTPQKGGHLVLGSGNLTNQAQNGRAGWTVTTNTPEQICIELWAATQACETEVSIQGQVSAVEEYQSGERGQ